MALVNQNVHKHETGVKKRRSKCSMFSLEVIFLPSIESFTESQCRCKMRRSYHRRNVHRNCTYRFNLTFLHLFILAFRNSLLSLHAIASLSPLVPLWSVIGLSEGGRQDVLRRGQGVATGFDKPWREQPGSTCRWG